MKRGTRQIVVGGALPSLPLPWSSQCGAVFDASKILRLPDVESFTLLSFPWGWPSANQRWFVLPVRDRRVATCPTHSNALEPNTLARAS